MAIKHVVLFKFKDGTSEATIQELIAGYQALPDRIPEMTHFEWGADVSVEGLHKGFTHCFITTFADTAGRDIYIPHPAHQAYVQILLPHLEDLLVLDFEPETPARTR
jgi:hypothetical protein